MNPIFKSEEEQGRSCLIDNPDFINNFEILLNSPFLDSFFLFFGDDIKQSVEISFEGKGQKLRRVNFKVEQCFNKFDGDILIEKLNFSDFFNKTMLQGRLKVLKS